MAPGQVGASKTALMVAAARGRVTSQTPSLLQDRWASRLAGEEGGDFVRQWEAISPNASLSIGLRARGEPLR